MNLVKESIDVGLPYKLLEKYFNGPDLKGKEIELIGPNGHGSKWGILNVTIFGNDLAHFQIRFPAETTPNGTTALSLGYIGPDTVESIHQHPKDKNKFRAFLPSV